MKLLFDLFPVILFFVAYKVSGIYVATGVAIAATVAQIAWLKLRGKTVEPMLWISLAIIVVFGGATLLLHDETFIKWKPTVLYWLFAAILLGSQWIWNKNLMRTLMGSQLKLPDAVWNKVNLSWSLFFLVAGALNLYVAFNFATDTWVNFKLFGLLGLMVVFVLAQGLFLAKHVQEESK